MNKNCKTKMINTLSTEQTNSLINQLHLRFHKNIKRHPSISWEKVVEKLHQSPEKLFSLNEMEISGGEPDIVELEGADKIIFCDCTF